MLFPKYSNTFWDLNALFFLLFLFLFFVFHFYKFIFEMASSFFGHRDSIVYMLHISWDLLGGLTFVGELCCSLVFVIAGHMVTCIWVIWLFVFFQNIHCFHPRFKLSLTSFYTLFLIDKTILTCFHKVISNGWFSWLNNILVFLHHPTHRRFMLRQRMLDEFHWSNWRSRLIEFYQVKWWLLLVF